MEPSKLLFCDYDGEFEYAEDLSRVGYVVDQIRPDHLRQVGVGEHHLFLFSFGLIDSLTKVLKTCEKLKYAELSTPIMLVARTAMGPDFLNHQKTRYAADAYLASPATESILLDALDALVRCPIPPSLKTKKLFSGDESQAEKLVESMKTQVARLESELLQIKSEREKTESILHEQRDALKPKLKALLEGQKLQFQTESERLKVALSEVEAKLLDREAKIKDLEALAEKTKKKIDEVGHQHEKAQATLREFYQNKLKSLEAEKKELEQRAAQVSGSLTSK